VSILLLDIVRGKIMAHRRPKAAQTSLSPRMCNTTWRNFSRSISTMYSNLSIYIFNLYYFLFSLQDCGIGGVPLSLPRSVLLPGGRLILFRHNTCSLARQPHTLRDGEEHEYHFYQYPRTQNRKNQGSPIQNKDHLNYIDQLYITVPRVS